MTSRRTRLAFTLVELLVVVGIIAILVAMLLPSLQKARLQAKDVECSATMRQCLMAIMTYNGDYKSGLKNYDPRCRFWGQGWGDLSVSLSDPHYQAGNYTDHLPTGWNTHFWDEGRALMCHWRGYLLNGKYASYKVLGCTAKDYRGEAYNVGFRCSYNGDPQSFFTGFPNDAEHPNEAGHANDSYKHRPAYVWYGPPGYNADNISEYAGGNFHPWSPMGNYKRPHTPLISCPQVNVWYNTLMLGVKGFETPHRPRKMWLSVAGMKAVGYAANVGFTDGSVRFFEDSRPGVIWRTYVPQ